MNRRFCVENVAEPKRMAAQVFTTNPMKVRTLGLMRESASQRTMVLRRTPQARPKALVQERQPDFAGDFAGGCGGCDLMAVDGGAVAIRPWPLFPRLLRRRRCRGWW